MDSVISLRLAVYGLALTCLCGCASTGNIVAPPAVELTSVALSDANIHRQTFLLGFRVENPNPFPLPVRAVEYTLLFDDEKFASGESIGSISVPAGGKTAFSISVELDFMRSASHVVAIVRRDDRGCFLRA